jgi:WD40 repeat protein
VTTGWSDAEVIRQAACRLAQELLRPAKPEMAGALAQALARLEPGALRQGLAQALQAVQDQASLDALWQAWQTSQAADLEALLLAGGRPAVYPLELSIHSALLLERAAEYEAGDAQVVAPLLAAAQSAHPLVSGRAQAALGRLTHPEAQEELCRWFIEHEHPAALQACLAAGYAPRAPLRRALFFLLSEQWERYQQLDFDASLLRLIYETADGAFRARIAEFARRTGWLGFAAAAAGERTTRRLDQLSEAEWEVVLALLSAHRRWLALWELAQPAPPVWSARILRGLAEAGWRPERPAEAAGYESLVALALASLEAGAPLECLPQPPLVLAGHRRLVTALTCTPDGSRLVSASADKTVRLWRLPSGEAERVFDEHTGYVLSAALSPDGNLLASGGGDRSVRLWDLVNLRQAGILGGHVGEVAGLAISLDGQWLASGDQRAVRLWRLADGSLAQVLGGLPAPVTALAFLPGHRQLAARCDDGTACLWRLPDGELAVTLMESASAWAIDPQGAFLATARQYGSLRLWQLPGGQLKQTLEGRVDGRALAVTPGGGSLAASLRENVRFWQLPGGSPLELAVAHPRPVCALAFSPNGRVLASGSEDGLVCLWQPGSSPAPVARLEGLVSPLKQLLFAPDGGWLAGAAGQNLLLWPLENSGALLRLPVERYGSAEIARLEALNRQGQLSPAGRAWFQFALGLARWRRRYDVEVEAISWPIQVGAYDIEIERAG